MIRLDWMSDGEESTVRFGRTLGRALRAPAWIGLIGPLGAGKTRLVQGLALGIGYAGRVRSPTFVLENRYAGGRCLLRHLDLYRLEHPDEEIEASWDEDLGSVVAVEWAERVEEPPPGAVILSLEPVDPTRRWIHLTWPGNRPVGDLRLEDLRKGDGR